MSSPCDSILKDGIRRTVHIRDDQELTVAFRQIFDLSYDQVKQESSQSGGSGGFAFAVLKLAGGGGSERENYERMRSEFHADESLFVSSFRSTDILLELADPNVVDAWKQCMSDDRRAQQRSNLKIELIGDPMTFGSTFVLAIQYVRTRPSDPSFTTITAVSVSPSLEMLTPTWKPGLTLNEFRYVTQTFRRESRDMAYVAIHTDAGDEVVSEWKEIATTVPPPPKIEQVMFRIETPDEDNAGTDANVTFQVGPFARTVSGTSWNGHDPFERGEVDEVPLTVDLTEEELRKSTVSIGHDNTGHNPGWLLSKVTLSYKLKGESGFRIIKEWEQVGWLATDESPRYSTSVVLRW